MYQFSFNAVRGVRVLVCSFGSRFKSMPEASTSRFLLAAQAGTHPSDASIYRHKNQQPRNCSAKRHRACIRNDQLSRNATAQPYVMQSPQHKTSPVCRVLRCKACCTFNFLHIRTNATHARTHARTHTHTHTLSLSLSLLKSVVPHTPSFLIALFQFWNVTYIE